MSTRVKNSQGGWLEARKYFEELTRTLSFPPSKTSDSIRKLADSLGELFDSSRCLEYKVNICSEKSLSLARELCSFLPDEDLVTVISMFISTEAPWRWMHELQGLVENTAAYLSRMGCLEHIHLSSGIQTLQSSKPWPSSSKSLTGQEPASAVTASASATLQGSRMTELKKLFGMMKLTKLWRKWIQSSLPAMEWTCQGGPVKENLFASKQYCKTLIFDQALPS